MFMDDDNYAKPWEVRTFARAMVSGGVVGVVGCRITCGCLDGCHLAKNGRDDLLNLLWVL